MNRISEIMLIDDDTPTNYLSKYIIYSKNCCEAITIFNLASDAIEDLKKRISINQRLPAIIFLDLNLPRMNGWEFLEIFQEFDLSKQATIPQIFILSTSMNPDDKIKADNIEAVSGFFMKPLNENIMDKIIHSS